MLKRGSLRNRSHMTERFIVTTKRLGNADTRNEYVGSYVVGLQSPLIDYSRVKRGKKRTVGEFRMYGVCEYPTFCEY